jgi:predicted trehalose synthase
MLQKVLYELTYELNNRPDWVSIPLRGLLALLGTDDADVPTALAAPDARAAPEAAVPDDA